MQTSCIILAAGKSRRFGAPKMRHQLSSGQTILQTTITRYADVFSQVLVVGHPKDEAHIESAGGVFISSPSAAMGMSQSLIAGVEAAKQADAWLIALGDMPYVQVNTIETLLENASTENIVIPVYQGRRGNPVILGQAFRSQIRQLEGDVGGKAFVSKHPEAVRLISVDDIGVVHDIDTPEAILDSVRPIVI